MAHKKKLFEIGTELDVRVVLGIRDGASEVYVLLACDVASLDNYRQTFRKSVLVSTSKVGMPKRKVIKCFFVEYETTRLSQKVGDY
jgi:hypothetical protein